MHLLKSLERDPTSELATTCSRHCNSKYPTQRARFELPQMYSDVSSIRSARAGSFRPDKRGNRINQPSLIRSPAKSWQRTGLHRHAPKTKLFASAFAKVSTQSLVQNAYTPHALASLACFLLCSDMVTNCDIMSSSPYKCAGLTCQALREHAQVSSPHDLRFLSK